MKTKSNEELSSTTRKSRLSEYKWSSYRFYIGLEKKPKWLNRRFVLSSWGGSASEKMHNYQKYVETGIKRDNTDDISALSGGIIIGSKSFKEDIVNKYLIHDVSDIDSREQPLLATINTFSVEDIIKGIKEYYNIKETEKITIRRGCHPEARKVAMFMTAKHCRRRETLTSLAKVFGVKISGFNSAADNFKKNLDNDRSLNNTLFRIEEIIKKRKQ